LASPLHDIGKISIPDRILNKPGKLDAEEWKIMQTHAQIGYEILNKSSNEILKCGSLIAHLHHEKWDGSGYPNQLKGEEINIAGRITALADVFDALGSERCYKKAWQIDDVVALIKEQRGKQFEPKLVDLFIENLALFIQINKQYPD
jgi:response regulator RpfG family c-di-GMP phosphodiesterase